MSVRNCFTGEGTVKQYQKPLLYNKLLPYADLLESEAKQVFDEIKRNLSESVQKREIWPGTFFWTLRLSSYLTVYDLHFSKEDHIKLVKLLFELITIPNLDSGLLCSWCLLVNRLLKKRRMLSPDDLQLPWKPVYELVKRVSLTKFKRLGMKVYSDRTVNAVKQFIGHVRCYFPIESTQEMLDEWRPLLCPFDTAMIEGAELFGEFLPTLVPVKWQDQTFKLWFDEFIHLWLISRNHPQLDQGWVKLFVRLARDNPGYIDWSPYIQQVFTRILNSFQLPMGPSEFLVVPYKKDQWNGDKPATLIVSMLGGETSAQEYLNKLMIALESYYHPSNIGLHTKKLMTFLRSLTNTFVERVKRERHSKPSWEPTVPSSAKLTEKDIDVFVECLLPTLWLALFTRRGIFDVAICIKNLAQLRPTMVLPELMERTYAALETLTEPHQVVSTLSCVTTVSRTLVSDERFPEGRAHVFNLLMLALPGIDPNDFQKMLSSSLLISALASLVPFVDCSSALGHVEMREDEAELCRMTSQFEDFVVQLLDRFFLLIENSAIHQDLGRIGVELRRGDSHEVLMSAGITGSIHSILSHCSPQIFEVTLDKLFRFATSHVFENVLAGKMCGDMCGASSKVDPINTLNRFIPHITSTIESILQDPEQVDSENADIELLWNLQLLSYLIGSDGTALLIHSDKLISCLKRCIHIKSKTGSKHAATCLYSILHCLTQTYPLESRITSLPLDLPPKDHLYIRDWGVSCKLEEANIKWHTPSFDELKLVDKLLEDFLRPEIQILQDFMDSKKTLDRDSLCQSLELVDMILKGVSNYLPQIEGPMVTGVTDSVVSLKRSFHIISKTPRVPPEEFSRKTLAEFFHKLTNYILNSCEDDTKSMLAIVNILKMLLSSFGTDKQAYEGSNQAFNQIKLTMGDNLHGKKKLVRPLIISKVLLLHDLRVMERKMSPLTPIHMSLLEDLSKMAISGYTEIRVSAQQCLNLCLEDYISSGRKLMPLFIPYLENNSEVTHEQFKGTLYMMLSPIVTMTMIRNWGIMREVLPILVKADHSEKSTILNLISHLHNTIQRMYDTFSINFEVSDSCLPIAVSLDSAITKAEEEEAILKLKESNTNRYNLYVKIVEELVDIMEAQHDLTQWRFTEITVKLLAMLIRQDVPYPLKGIQLLVNCLTHDAIAIRKVAIFSVTLILQQLKRTHKRVSIDLNALSPVKINDPLHLTPGERNDNKWLCIMNNEVEDELSWDSNIGIVNKTRYGYYCYPRTSKGYSPVSEQPKLNRTVDEMTEAERLIYQVFMDKEFVEKLISFLSLEEHKGKDHFDTQRTQMFKNLFRNYGSCVVEHFKPHLEKLAVDSQESSQRCASEIIAGLVRGSNHWSYKMMKEVREWLEPLLVKVLSVVHPETQEDWYQCFSEISADRDPRRILWLLKCLLKNPLNEGNGSFIDSCRLSLIQAVLSQQEWRIPSLLKEVSTFLSTQLDHPFKNVREKIGSLFSGIYLMDVSSLGFQILYSPLLTDLVEMFSQQIPNPQELITVTPDSQTLKICKTAMNVIVHAYQPSAVELYHIFSMVLPLAAYEDDDEIGQLIKLMCKQLCRCELSPEKIPSILSILRKAASCGLWKVKIPVLLILQVLAFWNLFTFSSSSSAINELVDLLLLLMEDTQIEVRELAASTVSGLVRCGFLSHDKVKILFSKQSRTKIPKKPKEETDSGMPGQEGHLVRRHCGVLGLAALVEACPYTVPDWLPDIVDELSTHLHDPAPIPSTVKKTMSEFKRTHHDNWREHKLKFTEDQLSALSDLLVSPSYYA